MLRHRWIQLGCCSWGQDQKTTVSQKGNEEAWGLTGKAFPDGVDVGREAPVSEDHKEKDGHYEKTLSPTSENLEAK